MKQKILFGLSLIFGLLLINGGLDKFLHYMPAPPSMPVPLQKDFEALMEISWLMPLIGFAEILGGVLIIFKKTRALGAMVIFPVMVGILLTHLIVDPANIIIALVIWAILLWIIYENREKYMHMIKE